MKIKRNILGLLVAFAMLLALPACSAGQMEKPETTLLSATEPQVMAITYAAAPDFTDVPAGADYAAAVAWCREQGLMNGTSATEFSPNATLTRAMVAVVLYRAAGEPAVSASPGFSDTQAGVWYSNAVTWTSGRGIVAGYGNGTFGPNNPVTKEQLDVMIRRYNGETPNFTGDPTLAVPATRAEAAMAFYAGLNESDTTEGGATETSTVYMTTEMTPEALVRLYDALKKTLPGNVVVRTPFDTYHLSPELVGGLAQHLDGTIAECNESVGSRISAMVHYQVAKDIGFADYAPIDILDEDGSMSLPVTNGTHLAENFVGGHLKNYESVILLTHFRSHSYAGYGGVLKSISIGVASGEGKSWIHSTGTSKTYVSGDLTDFKECVVDAASSVMDYMEGNIIYIDVIDGYSVECDCPNNGIQSEDIHSIGMLASTDPVALDKACLNLLKNSTQGAAVFERIERLNGLYLINHAYERGLGNIEYEVINID